MKRVQDLFREYVLLDKRRPRDGLNTTEFQRWMELKGILNKRFGGRAAPEKSERRESVRVDTKLKIAFESAGHFEHARLKNMSRGGLFVNTAFPPPLGTKLILKIKIEESNKEVTVPAEVVSNNISEDMSTSSLGMGLKFLDIDNETREALDQIYEEAGTHALKDC